MQGKTVQGKTRMSRLFRVASLLLVAGLFVAACGGGGSEGAGQGEAQKNVSIGYIPWDEDIAVTHLWQDLLEKQGYNVELKQLEVGPLFQGVARGDLDLFYDVWLPTTHQSYWEQYGDQVEKLGDWYDNASLEWTVPAYVEDVNSIADLKGKSAEFNGQIIGIEAGAGLTAASKDKVIPEYGLADEYTLKTSSTPAMLQELKRSIDAKRPVVVTLWHPHWAYSAYDLKDLEDPKGALGEAETLSVIGKQGFSDEFPEIAGWIKNFSMTDEQLASLENEMQKAGSGNETQAVDTWLQNNPDFATGLGMPSSPSS
ncbi:glycine betaine ABC transporter substrate-binding protein [Mycolicibacterium palauense]|uniref:glycine betaine ABC transporter substrate-binding protein n=1 Tax=Mycolicibacterium palauense TaxID=2034511 RepID=UPI001C3F2F87|nr:glycine betaine ABC transporter substrate-binding protein [Mycolicibacterium palauense]